MAEKKDVAIIGAGMSGLCMAIELLRRGISNFVVLEKSSGVGGTWYDNTYPGACCDVPSVLYSFSFEPNPNWSRIYSPHHEIRAYFEHCADKYGLRPHLRLNTAVAEAAFNEEGGYWQVSLANGEQLEARSVVSGLGQLNMPYIPDFEGAANFDGPSFHSARWNHDIDLSDKRVAVIGSAASALQFIPHVAAKVKQLYVYQRNANYVVERKDRAYTEVEQRCFARYPWLQKMHRLKSYLLGEWFFYPAMRSRSLVRILWLRWFRSYLKQSVSDPEVRDKLTPDYLLGCKRILLSDDYFQTFNRNNVELVTSPIKGIGERGVCSADDVKRDIDVLIYGTGFTASDLLSAVEFRGTGGQRLRQAWADGAEAYRGVCVAGFPNLFMLYGPNTNLGSNSIIFMVEQQVKYVASCIEKILQQNLHSLDVRPEVMKRYNQWMQQELGKMVWVSRCESWYKNAAGKVINNWPHSTMAYRRHMRLPDFSDFKQK
ncbi:MAG: flavin-containing monooxygenase [Parahaliea sp.]